jgi:hypothetical protein
MPARRKQKPQPRNIPREPSPYDGPENAKEAQRQDMPSRARPRQTKGDQTRGKDQTAREMTTEGARTRGRDQTAREMVGQGRAK